MSILANILNIQVNTSLLDNYCFYCVIYGATHFQEVAHYTKNRNRRAERVIETFKEDCCELSNDMDDDMNDDIDDDRIDNIKVMNYRSQKQSKTRTKRKTEKQQWKQIKEDNYYHVYSKQTITMSVIISTSSLNS